MITHLGQRQGALSTCSVQGQDRHPYFADPRSPWKPRPSTNIYSWSNKPAFPRSIEPSQFTSVRFTRAPRRDRSTAEHRHGGRLVRQCPRRGDQWPLPRVRLRPRRQRLGPRQPSRARHAVELATLSWVHWFNEERLHGYCGFVPPAEFEAAFYAAQQRPFRGLETNSQSLSIRPKPIHNRRVIAPVWARSSERSRSREGARGRSSRTTAPLAKESGTDCVPLPLERVGHLESS